MSQNCGGPRPYPVGIFKRQKTSVHGHRNVNKTDTNENNNVDRTINSQLSRNTTKPGSDIVKGPLDPIFGQHRAFPISIETANVNFSKNPSSAIEYLAQVRLEAAMATRMAIGKEADYETNAGKHGNTDIDMNIEKITTNDNIVDSQLKILGICEVLDSFTEEYKVMRKKYAEYRSQLTELNAIELPETQKEWKYFIFNNEPKYDFVAQIIEEGQHMKLMVYFTKWLNTKMDRNFEKWLIMVLEALDQYLSPSDLSVVRGLGKKARKQLRNSLDDRNRKIMFEVLTVTGKFYGQRDLLEDTDETLLNQKR